MIYIDSSIALAHLLAEPRMPEAASWNAPLVSSRLLQYEVWNWIHAYGLSGTHREEATALVGRVLLVDPSRPTLGRALEPFPIAVRMLDGLHLATIEFLRAQGVRAQLATYDNRLLAAARALGLPVAAL